MPIAEPLLPDWQRAHGDPLFQGLIRQSASDFKVSEDLGFAPTEDGEHDFLWIEKEGANTAWVARALAGYAGVQDRDVGYAGLKDRHAVTRQWFSVRRPSGAGTDWTGFELQGVRILDTSRHQRKLKRGAHSSNQFHLVVRGADAEESMIHERLEVIKSRGVPNYFGEQRFGRDGNNIRMALGLFAGKRMKREKRSIALSAARSCLFNHILQTRIRRNCWESALAGEAMNLDGSASLFVADQVTDELRGRLECMDIHPTGALWGNGDPICRSQAAEIDRSVAESFEQLSSGIEGQKAKLARRALRLPVRQLSWETSDELLRLNFSLDRGGYATAVLREVCSFTSHATGR